MILVQKTTFWVKERPSRDPPTCDQSVKINPQKKHCNISVFSFINKCFSFSLWADFLLDLFISSFSCQHAGRITLSVQTHKQKEVCENFYSKSWNKESVRWRLQMTCSFPQWNEEELLTLRTSCWLFLAKSKSHERSLITEFNLILIISWHRRGRTSSGFDLRIHRDSNYGLFWMHMHEDMLIRFVLGGKAWLCLVNPPLYWYCAITSVFLTY